MLAHFEPDSIENQKINSLHHRLSQILEDGYVKPIVSVNITQADGQRFWMLGQIKVAGAYLIKKPITLVDAISFGRGLLSNGKDREVGNPEAAGLKRATLIRNGDLISVNFDTLIREGDLSQNVCVRAGDYIFAPSLTARSICILGEVSQPGPVYSESAPPFSVPTLRQAESTRMRKIQKPSSFEVAPENLRPPRSTSGPSDAAGSRISLPKAAISSGFLELRGPN